MLNTRLRRALPRTPIASGALAALVWLAPGFASAADPMAEQLYQEGRKAASQKDWDVACKKFKESHDREPAPGTLLNLGDCEEKRGKLVAAQSHFVAAGRLFRVGDERAIYAKQRAAQLERRTPKLTLRLHPSSPVGTNVERDGVALDAGTINVAVPVDPGEHVLLVRAPGRLEVRSTVKLVESESRELELAAGAPAPSAAAGKADDASKAGLASRVATHEVRTAVFTDAPAPATKSGSPAKTIGFVSLGVGAVALGVGIVGGLKTMEYSRVADDNCRDGCNPIGANAQRDGKAWSNVGTAGFIVGGIGLATGAALVLFAPRTARAPQTGLAIQAVPGGSQLRFGAEF